MTALGSLVSLVFDPVGLVFAALVAIAVSLWRKPSCRAAFFLSVTSALMLFVLGNPIVANHLLGLLETRAERLATCPLPGKGGIYVVLAGGIQGSIEDVQHYERLKDSSLRRVIPAVRLARQDIGSTVIMSGGIGDAIREADLMAAMAQDLGMPRERILVERESRSTAQSARLVMPMVKTPGERPVYLVSAAGHLPRAYATFQSAGLNICAYPVDFRRLHPPWTDGFLPRITALWKSIEALRELFSYAAYVMLGSISS
jgi:uncharacterized SAM-binding protein YcdF (DUF218 family)